MTIDDTERAAFHSMTEGTALDWSIIAEHNMAFADQAAFDPSYVTLPLEHFEPAVRQ